VRLSNESLLIGAGVFAVAFGVLVTTLEHIRHPPAKPVINFTGIAGVYLGFYAETEHVAWVYAPCLILMLGATAAQLRSSRPSRTNDDDHPVDGIH
jgi:xanthosine utilization system XapX-like protein